MGHLARKFYDNRYQTMAQLENITMDVSKHDTIRCKLRMVGLQIFLPVFAEFGKNRCTFR